jgi:hypothetical protein
MQAGWSSKCGQSRCGGPREWQFHHKCSCSEAEICSVYLGPYYSLYVDSYPWTIICRCTTWMCSILVMVNEWSIGFYWWHWLDVPLWICVFIHPNAITITISWTISQFRETHIKHMYEKRFGPPLGCVLRLNALGVVGKFCWVPLGKYTFPHLPIQSTKLLGNDWNPPNQLPWCFWFQTLCYLHHIS